MTRTVVQPTCRTDDMIHAMVPTNCLRLICRQRRGRTSSLETKRMKASGNSNSVSSLRPSVAGFLLPTYCCCTTTTTFTLTHTLAVDSARPHTLTTPHSPSPPRFARSRAWPRHAASTSQPTNSQGDRPTDPVIDSLLTHYRAPRFSRVDHHRHYHHNHLAHSPTRLLLLPRRLLDYCCFFSHLQHQHHRCRASSLQPLALASRLLASARARQLCSRSRGPAAAIRSRATPTRIPQSLALWTSTPIDPLLATLLPRPLSHHRRHPTNHPSTPAIPHVNPTDACVTTAQTPPESHRLLPIDRSKTTVAVSSARARRCIL